MSGEKSETSLVSCRFCGRKLRLQEVRSHYAREHAEAWRRHREAREAERAEKRRWEAERLLEEFRVKAKAIYALATLENAAFFMPEGARDRYCEAVETVKGIVKAALSLEEV